MQFLPFYYGDVFYSMSEQNPFHWNIMRSRLICYQEWLCYTNSDSQHQQHAAAHTFLSSYAIWRRPASVTSTIKYNTVNISEKKKSKWLQYLIQPLRYTIQRRISKMLHACFAVSQYFHQYNTSFLHTVSSNEWGMSAYLAL